MNKVVGMTVIGALVPMVLLSASNSLNLRDDGIQFPDGTVQTTAAGGKSVQGFYLTEATFPGAAALTACASGFHMASAWELGDLSNLQPVDVPGAISGASGFDMNGYTPPTATPGWFRTGAPPVVANNPGVANCSAWTSSDPSHFGSVSELVVSDQLTIEWGNLFAGTCDFPRRVWCAED